MARTYAVIDAKLADFLVSQPVFFVATAPLTANGHVNCSPKGNDGAFQVLDEMRVAYRDLTGSGVETIAHLRENGRIVLMFCAFWARPASCASTDGVRRCCPATPVTRNCTAGLAMPPVCGHSWLSMWRECRRRAGTAFP